MKNKNKELTHSHSFFEHIMDHLDHGFISELCTLIALNLFISSIHGFLVLYANTGWNFMNFKKYFIFNSDFSLNL